MTPNSSDSLSRSMQWSIVCNTKLSEHRKYKVSSINTAENVIQDTQCYSLCARAAVTCRLKSIQQILSQIVGQMICNNLFQKFGKVRQVWNRAVIPGVVWIKPWFFFSSRGLMTAHLRGFGTVLEGRLVLVILKMGARSMSRLPRTTFVGIGCCCLCLDGNTGNCSLTSGVMVTVRTRTTSKRCTK